MFISGGENIHPEKIEQALLLHPMIEQVIVVESVDEQFGYRPVAAVVTTSEIKEEELTYFLSDKLTSYELPIRYELMPESLLNTGIKISRQKVREWVNDLLPA